MAALSRYVTMTLLGYIALLLIPLESDAMISSFKPQKFQLVSSLAQLSAFQIEPTFNSIVNIKKLLLKPIVSHKLLKRDQMPIHKERTRIFMQLRHVQHFDYAKIWTFNAVFDARHTNDSAI